MKQLNLASADLFIATVVSLCSLSYGGIGWEKVPFYQRENTVFSYSAYRFCKCIMISNSDASDSLLSFIFSS